MIEPLKIDYAMEDTREAQKINEIVDYLNMQEAVKVSLGTGIPPVECPICGRSICPFIHEGKQLKCEAKPVEKVYVGISKCCNKPAYRYGSEITPIFCQECLRICDIYKPLVSGMEEVIRQNLGTRFEKSTSDMAKDLALALKTYIGSELDKMERPEPTIGYLGEPPLIVAEPRAYNQAITDVRERLT